MIASELKLNRMDCKTLKIRDAYSIHKIIYSLFPQADDNARDFLFADKGGGFNERRILILSKRNPLNPEIGTLLSKEVPEKFLQFDQYAFEILLNPAKCDKSTGKMVAVRGKDNLHDWFKSKVPTYGFEVDPETLVIQNIGVQSFEKNGSTVLHGKAAFIGKLTVTDRKLFISAFTNGIGRGKSFGFGLLQIVPLYEQVK